MKKSICMLTIAALISGTVQIPVAAQETDMRQRRSEGNLKSEIRLLAEENGITVSTRQEFMDALQQHKSPITVSSIIVIGKEADVDQRMLPVKIPAGTVIRGTQGSSLVCRCPIQLEGDVCFQDIKLCFESTDALGSVPHREIFLAGHGLTFDNVSTWLEGGGSSLGGIGGTEEELLPTVYAGGYSGTQIGENASLTVRNSNSGTMFQAIYMGHEAGSDNKVSYQGEAVLNLDTGVTVREKVDVSKNSRAEITVAGDVNSSAKAKQYYGNENTTFTLCRSMIEGAVVDNIGHIVVTEKGCLTSETTLYGDVTLQQGGCLDLSRLNEAFIEGDFTGVSDSGQERSILVVNPQSSLTIMGNVTGTTQLQTLHRLTPGTFNIGCKYISANEQKTSADNFVLPEVSIQNGFRLNYDKGVWSVGSVNQEEVKEIGEIRIVSAPTEVYLGKIMETQDGAIPDENVYFEIIWKDVDGNEISSGEAEELMLYEADYVFMIKTEYWESDEPDIQEKMDWNNAITLIGSPEYPGKYFLQAYDGVKPGKYTFLFCSEYYTDALNTVQDVKGLKDRIKAQCSVMFLDKEPEQPQETEQPTPTMTAGPTMMPTPTKQPASTEQPTMTAKPALTAGPTKQPQETEQPMMTAGPTMSPTEQPQETEQPTMTAEPTLTPEHVHKFETVLVQATLENDGVRIQKCGCGDVAGQQLILRPQAVVVSAKPLVYTGKAQRPAVYVTDTAGNVISSENYELLYENNIKAGRASVTIVFGGDYSGRVTKFFDIVPKKVTKFRLVSKSKAFFVKWKKQGVQTTGYEIQYSTNKKFAKKSVKTVTVKNNKVVSRKVSGKKAGKRYYVRIRAYKSVKVDGSVKKFYSAWSKVKSVK